jgi:hypothetical protein
MENKQDQKAASQPKTANLATAANAISGIGAGTLAPNTDTIKAEEKMQQSVKNANFNPSSPLPESHDEIKDLEMQQDEKFERKEKVIAPGENDIEPGEYNESPKPKTPIQVKH